MSARAASRESLSPSSVGSDVGGGDAAPAKYSVANAASSVEPLGQYPVWNQVRVRIGGTRRSAPAGGRSSEGSCPWPSEGENDSASRVSTMPKPRSSRSTPS